MMSFRFGYSGCVPYTSFIEGNNDSKDMSSVLSFDVISWESSICWWLSSSSELESSLELQHSFHSLQRTGIRWRIAPRYDIEVTWTFLSRTSRLTSYYSCCSGQSSTGFSYLNFCCQPLPVACPVARERRTGCSTW